MFPGDARWNTWYGEHPLTMVHLPTGLGLFLGVFTSANERYELLGSGPIELRDHALDGSYVSAVAHAGENAFDVQFGRRSTDELVLRVAPITLSSWGLRVWLSVELAFTDVRSGPDRFETEGPAVRAAGDDGLLARHRSTYLHCLSTVPPVHRQFFGSRNDLPSLLENQGYYAPHADDGHGAVGVLRYTFQTHPVVTVVLGGGTDETMAQDAAAAAAETGADDILATARERATISRPAAAAVRDVVAWNTVWDPANHRVTTTASRNWLGAKFGGWGVWFTDALWHAILAASAGDASTARANLVSAMDAQTPAGMYPGLRTQYQEWVDRSQPPMAAYAIWRVRSLLGDDSIVSELYDTVLRNHEWWFAVRGRGTNHLFEYGSSDTGSGAFRHTKQAAMDESSMDNLPQFDSACFDPSTHTLDLAEPGLNSLLVLEADLLARMADLLGRPDGPALRERSSALARQVRVELWDPERRIFAARRRDGSFVESLAATAFYPMIAGIADDKQIDALLEHLFDPQEFGGQRPPPVSTHNDPASNDDVYWRGRIWPPVLFLIWDGLRRSGRVDTASRLADAAWGLFAEGWDDHRACRENFHRHTASGDATPDSDGYYTWGALLALMRALDEADCSPWHDGVTFAPRDNAEPVELVQALTRWRARREGDVIVIDRDGTELLRASHCASVTIRSSEGRVRVSAQLEGVHGELAFSDTGIDQVVGAWRERADGSWVAAELIAAPSDGHVIVAVDGSASPAHVDLVLLPESKGSAIPAKTS